jgi:hypothetical protein
LYFEIDLTTVPPSAVLREPEDFSRFDVVVPEVENAFVDEAEVRRLAGLLGEDPKWQEGLKGMLAYAGSHGWIGEDGSIQAHISYRQ